jgi:predicted permease
MWKDLKLSLRILVHQPLLTIIVIVTLTIGIGGSTAIFSVFNAVLLRKLPYPNPDRILIINSVAPDGSPAGKITPTEFWPYYEEKHPMVQAAALAWSQTVQIVGSDRKGRASRRYGVTDQFFEIFGNQMYLGRPFKRGQMPGVIILAYSTWRDVFGSDPKIIGKPIQSEGMQLQVVGITQPDFDFPEKPGYWYLMNLGHSYDRVRGYRGYVRLKPGCSLQQFQREVTSHAVRPGFNPTTYKPAILTARPFFEYVVGNLRPTVTILFGATMIILLIACINVTNILLSRATVRSREMALREALGAGRWRILRQLLMESLLLSIAGGALGIAFAGTAVRILLRIAPPNLPRLDRVSVDSTVLLFALGVSIFTGVLIGLAPALRLSRNQLHSLINESGRGGVSGGYSRTRLFSGLVVAETALAVLLVIGAGLLVRSYFNLTSVDPGFNSERVLTFSMNVPGRYFPINRTSSGITVASGSPYAPMAEFFRELQERIKGLPGVQTVADTVSLPFAGYQFGNQALFTLPDQPGGSSKDTAQSAYNDSVSSDFFKALKIRLLAGRTFNNGDSRNSPGVAVVNKAFMRRFFPGKNPLGQRILFTDNRWTPQDTGFQFAFRSVDELQIVGVVEDIKYLALADPPEPRIYLSNQQWIVRNRAMIIRTTMENPERLITLIRKEIESMDRQLNPDFALLSSIVHSSLARERLGTALLVIFGLAALILAAIGIYGLMAYSIAQRSGEIAVRSAMGASGRQIMTLVMGRGVGLAIGGIVLGSVGAAASRQIIAAQLYGVTAIDLQVFTLSCAFLFGVAVIACFIPALHAMKIPPADLLRTE